MTNNDTASTPPKLVLSPQSISWYHEQSSVDNSFCKSDTPVVLVTGAAGFIACHIIKMLLEKGYNVRGTVRDAQPPKGSVTHRTLQRLRNFNNANTNLKFVEVNLTKPHGWRSAVDGCTYVIHCASPHTFKSKNPHKEIVLPACLGVKHVFESCLSNKSVRKVIMTSSIMTVSHRFDSRSCGKMYDESDWNTSSTVESNAYTYSKAQAEKTALQFMKKYKSQIAFNLALINPSVVIGPSYRPEVNQSVELIKKILFRQMPGIIDIAMGYVDVRDVATAHILAMENPRANGRYICDAGTMHLKDIAEVVQASHPEHRIRKMKLPSFAVRGSLFACTQVERRFIADHLGRPWHIDNSRIRGDLGLKFTGLDKSVVDTCNNLLSDTFNLETSRILIPKPVRHFLSAMQSLNFRCNKMK